MTEEGSFTERLMEVYKGTCEKKGVEPFGCEFKPNKLEVADYWDVTLRDILSGSKHQEMLELTIQYLRED